MQQGAMLTEQDHEVWEFSNQNFARDRPDLLPLLTRKKTRTEELETPDLSTISLDVAALKRNQVVLSNELTAVQQENAQLWRECANLRSKHQKQGETVNRILRFLASVIPHHAPVQAMTPTTQDSSKRKFILGDDDVQSRL